MKRPNWPRMPGSPCRSESGNGGTSLIEILVVLVILTTFLVPVTMSFTEVRRQTYDSKNLVTATTIGFRMLEDLKGHLGMLFMSGFPPDRAVDFPASFSAPVKEGGTVFTPTPQFKNLMEDGRCVGKKVTVVVGWSLPGSTRKEHSISFSRLVYAGPQP